MKNTHSDQLERMIGKEQAEQLSRAMRGWYGSPIPVMGLPNLILAHGDGDFSGELRISRYLGRCRRGIREFNRRVNELAKGNVLSIGFGSVDALKASGINGKRTDYIFNKSNLVLAIGQFSSAWAAGAVPPAGAAGSAAPGGRAVNSATVGGFGQTDPSGTDTQFIVNGSMVGTGSSPATLLIYDRIFDVAKTMNSTATEAVTGVPTRYQTTTAGAVDSAENNFLFVEVGTVLPATAHNWNVCQYTSQSGTAGQNLPSVVGQSAAPVNSLDIPSNQFFCPLASGDTGIKALTQIQSDALVATGAINFVIGHAYCWLLSLISNPAHNMDYVNTSMGLPRIFNGACPNFLALGNGTLNARGLFTSGAG